MKKILILLILNIFILSHASTLNLSMSSSPNRLNPILANDSASSQIADWLFNGMLKYDKDGNPSVDLASSYHFETPTKLIINLRKDVYWHDDIKFTAKDVIFTYEKIIDPKVFNSIKSNFKDVKSVRALDDYKIEIIYQKPSFKALQTWMVGILPYHILKNEKNLMTSSFNKKPIGTGPYKISGFEISKDIELFANENYFEGKPKIDKLLYKFIPDENTSFLFLKQNKLDLGGLSPLQIDRQLEKSFTDSFDIYERPAFSYSYLGFNLRKDKFKNKKIREAIALAIDKQELVDILFFGHGKVCNGPFLPGSFAYDEKTIPTKQNIIKSKQLLKEEGFDKNNPFSFEVITNTGNATRINAAQILQYQLKKAGIDMKIRVMEWQAYLNTVVHPRKFDAILLGWSLALMPDAYPLWHSDSDKTGRFNLVGYKNKKVDELIEKGSTTVDRNKLAKIYKQIFKQITNDYPYIFLYIPNSIQVVNKNIKNIELSFTGLTHNQKDWIKE
jgi:peptide/nickel transport system substrate-binding protein